MSTYRKILWMVNGVGTLLTIAVVGLFAQSLLLLFLIEEPLALVLSGLAGFAIGLRRSGHPEAGLLAGNALVLTGGLVEFVGFTNGVQLIPVYWTAVIGMAAGSGLIVASLARLAPAIEL